MDLELDVRSGTQLQPKTLRGARKAVRLGTRIVTAKGLAMAQVTNLSPRGCGLFVLKALTRHQHLALDVYAEDSASALHIPLAQVQWTKGLTAGVEFISLSLKTQLRLLQLCGD